MRWADVVSWRCEPRPSLVESWSRSAITAPEFRPRFATASSSRSLQPNPSAKARDWALTRYIGSFRSTVARFGSIQSRGGHRFRCGCHLPRSRKDASPILESHCHRHQQKDRLRACEKIGEPRLADRPKAYLHYFTTIFTSLSGTVTSLMICL